MMMRKNTVCVCTDPMSTAVYPRPHLSVGTALIHIEKPSVKMDMLSFSPTQHAYTHRNMGFPSEFLVGSGCLSLSLSLHCVLPVILRMFKCSTAPVIVQYTFGNINDGLCIKFLGGSFPSPSWMYTVRDQRML